MEIDMHYQATYLAARLAGFDKPQATTIAHAAQYVDESDMSRLQDKDAGFWIRDFKPHPTVQSTNELIRDTVNLWKWDSSTRTGWSEAYLRHLRRVWACFHFLPGNYGPDAPFSYEGPTEARGWRYDDQCAEEFSMLCLTNSPLVANMVNDLLNHQDQPYLPHLIGVRMHVLADTWAHTYFAGTPSWCVNEADNPVTRVFPDGSTAEIKWGPGGQGREEFSPGTSLSYWGMPFLGHGRMGHLPDYPFMRYMYPAKWSGQPIFKNNPRDYLNGMGQMIQAMRCVLTGQPFVINQYAPLSEDVTFKINALIQMLENTDASVRTRKWAEALDSWTFDGQCFGAPPPFRADAWLDEYKRTALENQPGTDYYRFNQAAVRHVQLVGDVLRTDAAITIQENPNCAVQRVQLASRSGRPVYIGPMSRSSTLLGGIKYCFPRAATSPISLQLVMVDGRQTLETGGLVKIITEESAVGPEDCLGDWRTSDSLYYYYDGYAPTRQSWLLEKADGSSGPIRSGDAIRLRNQETTKAISCGREWLSTSSGTSADTEWVIHYL